MTAFGISPQAASTDLKRFQADHPGVIAYDGSLKVFKLVGDLPAVPLAGTEAEHYASASVRAQAEVAEVVAGWRKAFGQKAIQAHSLLREAEQARARACELQRALAVCVSLTDSNKNLANPEYVAVLAAMADTLTPEARSVIDAHHAAQEPTDAHQG